MSYVSVVTDFFTTRKGDVDFSFSPEDYATIAEWEKQEIPLAFVLNTIDRVMNESRSRSRDLRSIGELDHSVCADFAEWLRSQRPVSSC
jgi:hypothetical protein